ncbi:class I SAM-dependent methyltransferase [Streptomyces sp. SID3343]|uniref:class I SAM-dependent methyltransferase n=1 Tax=Streptomyces sp. SID3343 TaxID=2690260 RepID=UPI00136F286B|nr:class I SAM-dependent methyltransferase [Streptomyces sp. SID3343]MYW01245.1 methyltransferase domain-containing protein [Streptomyces sp. SID3343]
MIDYYSTSAEFYDLVAARHVTSSGPALSAVLADVDATAGPVVEIGAGTGRVTQVIAAALPHARIVAAEPSATMRAVLASRVARDPDLRRRVSITDGTAQDMALPEKIGAAVIFGVAGHLDRRERIALWRRLAAHLAPGGLVAVELMGTAAPRPMPPTLSLSERIGRQVYEWWIAAEPVAADRTRFSTTWKVLDDDGRLVREVTDTYDWHAYDLDRLAAESGMTVRRITRVGSHVVPHIGVLVA